jgi:hypothetical protein
MTELRIALFAYARTCVCRGSRRLRGHKCPGCHRAWSALEGSEHLLLPAAGYQKQALP